MATSDRPHTDNRPEPNLPPAAAPNKSRPAEFYDTKFIVGRLKDDQRRSRLRFYLAVGLTIVVFVSLYTFTARRAEAPKSQKTDPVVIESPTKASPPSRMKGGHPAKPRGR